MITNDKEKYSTPTVEMLLVTVESGFASTSGAGTEPGSINDGAWD